MISDNNDTSDNINKYKTLTKKALGKIWIWSSTYIKKKAISAIESSVVKYLDENAGAWAELPAPDDDTDSEAEDAEIDD